MGAVGRATPAMHCLAAWGLVTWHQSKNPQDGSCGTDCPHALPRSKPVVIRLDFLCVFPVSGRAHPARQPSRTTPWARHAVLWGTDAHMWPPPDRQTPTWRLPRQLCADMARAQSQGTIVAPRTYPCAVVARPSGQSAVVARPSWQSAAVAPPKRSSANVAPLQWRHTTVVQPPWRSVRGTAPSWHCPASPMPPWRQFSGRAPSWCRQRTRAPSWRNPHGRTPPRRSQATLRRRGAGSLTWHHRGAVNVHVRRRGATFRAERHRGAAQTVFVRQPGHGVSSKPILEAPWRGLHLALRQPP